MKSFIKTLLYVTAVFATGSALLWANPFEQLTPDQSLYQRVKKLENYGLLDPEDKAVLDEGKIVTRLELAFYTEKAKARIAVPQLSAPSTPTPLPVAPPVLEAPALPESGLPAPVVPVPTAAPLPVTSAVQSEILDLLKQLRDESEYLRTRLSLNDERIRKQEDQLEKLKAVQDEVDKMWKTANKASGMPHFSTYSVTTFENVNVSGPNTNGQQLQNNAIRSFQKFWVDMYTDMGGKGALDCGFGFYLPYSNASGVFASGVGTSPVSLFIGNPSATFNLYGDLGKWDTTFAVEAYQPDTTLGNFSRGFATYAIKRFEDPFGIKNWNDDKNAKNWDDYMTSVTYVPAYSPTVGNVQSASDRVFDGIFAVGKDLPFLPAGGKMTLMAGRMGTSPTATQRWEEAAKIDQPWADSLVRTAFSTEWVNDQFGVNQPIQLDMRDYSANFKFNLKPVFIELDGGLSHFATGAAFSGPGWTDSANAFTGASYKLLPTTQSFEGLAGQASILFYPFTFYYFSIGPNYSDFQSRVMMSGINFFHYGIPWNPSDFNNAYGAVAEADTLQSDRYGWRVNFGWNGRHQDFMKQWPGFLDNFVINLDVTQKKEFEAEYSPMGYNVIEPFQMIRFYYPDDEGLWGLNLWGNYAPNVNPLRQAYIGNIQALRNDNDILNDDVRYQFRLSSERLPLVLPVYNNGTVPLPVYSVNPANANQAPATYTAANAPSAAVVGQNIYVNLNHLKSYNYLALTTKWQLNKFFDIPSAIDVAGFMTFNTVSGVSSSPSTATFGGASVPVGGNVATTIPNLFEQKVYNGDVMVNVLHDVDLMADFGLETWDSDYTYPRVHYTTKAWGLGFAYDIPWCGGKMELRFKNIDFTDNDVPLNNYGGAQVYTQAKFMF